MFAQLVIDEALFKVNHKLRKHEVALTLLTLTLTLTYYNSISRCHRLLPLP